MYARVATWEGGDAEAVRRSGEQIRSQGEEAGGAPEGVPSNGFLLLVDPDGGRSLGIALFETEEDMRKGDETLNQMSPPDDGLGRRSSVEFYEVAADFRV
jgi:hypothetical protein